MEHYDWGMQMIKSVIQMIKSVIQIIKCHSNDKKCHSNDKRCHSSTALETNRMGQEVADRRRDRQRTHVPDVDSVVLL